MNTEKTTTALPSELLNISAVTLLKLALTTRDTTVLAALRARVHEVLSAVEGPDEPLTPEEAARLEPDPEWVSQVVAVLAQDEASHTTCASRYKYADKASAMSRAIQELHDREELKLCDAFRRLVAVLPAQLTDWHSWFGHLPHLKAKAAFDLATQWQYTSRVDEASPHAGHLKELAVFGLTPASFFEATVSLTLLFDAVLYAPKSSLESGTRIHHKLWVPFEPGDLQAPANPQTWIVIPYEDLLWQMRTSSDCPPLADRVLLHWTCLAAMQHPIWIEGYRLKLYSGAAALVVKRNQ